MGISGIILILFLFGIILLAIGFIKKNKSLKVFSAALLAISITLFLLVWNALGYM